jgi:hypothetical protein
MIFFFNICVFLGCLAILFHIGIESAAPLIALRENLREDHRQEVVVQKCAQHQANLRNSADAFRYLVPLFPAHKEELHALQEEFSEKITKWQESVACNHSSSYPLAAGVRRTNTPHLHPWWPNFVSGYYMKDSF